MRIDQRRILISKPIKIAFVPTFIDMKEKALRDHLLNIYGVGLQFSILVP